jgi:hypothetical protein
VFCFCKIQPLVLLFIILPILLLILAFLLREIVLDGFLGYVNPNTFVVFLTALRLALLDLEFSLDILFLFSEQSDTATGFGAGADSASTGPDNGASSKATPGVESSENIDKA